MYGGTAKAVGKGIARAGLGELGTYETLIPNPQKIGGHKLPGWATKDFVRIDPQKLSFKWGWHQDPNDVGRFKEEWRRHPVQSGLATAAVLAPGLEPLARGAGAARALETADRLARADAYYARVQAARGRRPT